VHYKCRVKYFKISTISKHLKSIQKKKKLSQESRSMPKENWTTKSMHLCEVVLILINKQAIHFVYLLKGSRAHELLMHSHAL